MTHQQHSTGATPGAEHAPRGVRKRARAEKKAGEREKKMERKNTIPTLRQVRGAVQKRTREAETRARLDDTAHQRAGRAAERRAGAPKSGAAPAPAPGARTPPINLYRWTP